MKFEDHCEECLRKLGKPYEEIHRWLDEFAGIKPWGMRHRCFRHHLQGISEVKNIFGEEAGQAAILHIISDLKLEQWNESMPFPKDKHDYIKMGLF